MRRDLEKTPVHRSLLTPVPMLGIEREVVMVLVCTAAILLFAPRLNLVTPTLAVLLLAGGIPALRRLARRDPWFFRVLRRHASVAAYYPAQPHHTVRRRAWPPTL